MLVELSSSALRCGLVFLGLVFVIRLFLPVLAGLKRPGGAPVAAGVLFGIAALGAAQAPFMLGDFVRGDLHNVVLVGAAVFGGPPAALLATAIAALHRLAFGGAAPVALLGMAGAAGLGIAFHRWAAARRGGAARPGDYLALGLALAVVTIALPFVLTIGDAARLAREVAIAESVLPVVLVAYPIATLALCVLVRDGLRSSADLATLRRANATLRASESRFRDFADVASDWLWETDADHRFTFISPIRVGRPDTAGAAALGQTRWEFSKADLSDPKWRDHLADLAARRPFARFQYEGIDEAGGSRWVMVSGRPYFGADGAFLGYRGAATDRTAQKRMETAAQESAMLLRAFIDTMPDLISLKDGQGRYLIVNRRFGEPHGIASEAVIGKTVEDFGVPDEVAAVAADERQVRATGRPVRREAELTFKGTKRSVVVLKFPIVRRDDPEVMIGTIITDVTELKRLRERLHHAQKMETVGQLTGGIAHDFNNLLTVVLGNTELLIEQLSDRPQLLRLAETARRGALRAAELVSRLLAFSRRQMLAPAAFDLNQLVAGLTGLLQRELGDGVELRTRLGDGLWPALADPRQVESVVLNLATNARDAMPAGGTLTIATGNVELDKAYARDHQEVTPGRYVLLSVTDTGRGMTSEVAARAFEPFFTTKEVGKGTGLGLSMVYGFVKQSAGHVELSSEVGLGTTVSVFLPCAEPPGKAH